MSNFTPIKLFKYNELFLSINCFIEALIAYERKNETTLIEDENRYCQPDSPFKYTYCLYSGCAIFICLNMVSEKILKIRAISFYGQCIMSTMIVFHDYILKKDVF